MMIDLFNSTISNAINKNGDFYKAFIGESEFTPEVTIVDSEDINCGAICNELEFARIQAENAAISIQPNNAYDDILDLVINAFINLSRRGSTESDDVYKQRFNFLVRNATNVRRGTRWALIDALTELGLDSDDIYILEKFDFTSLYFEVRLVGEALESSATLFLDDYNETGFLDQPYFLGGIGIGTVITFVSELIKRFKSPGVNFNVIIIQRDVITKTSDADIVLP